ncbi:MAG: YqhA family protein [Leptolyngbyaceae cyanobacterium RU_5_1]|nr:YqhA family protein [Leptolyngbyaceae cyanobacterium RU_5_1]
MLSLKRLEAYFEACLWKFRLFTLVPVLFGLISTLEFFVLGTFEILNALMHSFQLDHVDESTVVGTISLIIGGIDLYLVGVVLLIFSFGIYEIFISQIQIKFRNRDIKILEITTLDQLKHKILQVIIMVLIISFFKKVLSMEIKSQTDLVYMAASILIIATSSYLLHLQSHHDKHGSEHAEGHPED